MFVLFRDGFEVTRFLRVAVLALIFSDSPPFDSPAVGTSDTGDQSLCERRKCPFVPVVWWFAAVLVVHWASFPHTCVPDSWLG